MRPFSEDSVFPHPCSRPADVLLERTTSLVLFYGGKKGAERAAGLAAATLHTAHSRWCYLVKNDSSLDWTHATKQFIAFFFSGRADVI